LVYYAPLDPIEKYGTGWAWDDYAYSFQVERSTLPLYGNRLTFRKLALELDGTVTPAYFKDFVVEDPSIKRFATRLPDANAFAINSSLIDEVPFERTLPFVVSDYDIAGILSDLTGREIELKYDFDHDMGNNSIIGSSMDTLYRRLMWNSDNFIAEQLLIQVADKQGIDSDSVIRLMLDSDFSTAPQELQWYDGSGLSRYNLFTPQSLVWILEKLYRDHDFNYLKEIFPAGGGSGTIQDLYGLPGEPPFIFAKTGTLRNRHCLSGFLVTRRSKVLIFSFMHSNFLGSSGGVKKDMEELLMTIREKY
jgi:D-alanyl-D-alanine carboxypeptidase/D-alanyl-D-alanine-endopeptidase (penicillin-binding protein 4)